MDLAEGIRKIGFRRWYERQLLESHFFLVTALLCLILALACLEGFSFQALGFEPFLRLVAMFAGGAVGVASFRRYLEMLNLALRAGERSTCGKCGVNGQLEVIGWRSRPRTGEKAARPSHGLAVRCRKCGHEWLIE